MQEGMRKQLGTFVLPLFLALKSTPQPRENGSCSVLALGVADNSKGHMKTATLPLLSSCPFQHGMIAGSPGLYKWR